MQANNADYLGEQILGVKVLTAGESHYSDSEYRDFSRNIAFWNVVAGRRGAKAENIDGKTARVRTPGVWSGSKWEEYEIGKGVAAAFKFEYEVSRECYTRRSMNDFTGGIRRTYEERSRLVDKSNYRFGQWLRAGSGFFSRKANSNDAWIEHKEWIKFRRKKKRFKHLPGRDGPFLNDAFFGPGDGIPEGFNDGDGVSSWAGDALRWTVDEKGQKDREYKMVGKWLYRAEDKDNAWEGGGHWVSIEFNGDGEMINFGSGVIRRPHAVPKNGGGTAGWWTLHGVDDVQ